MSDRLHKTANSEQIWSWLLPIAIVLMGTGLAFYQLGNKGLWLDEVTTVQIAVQDVCDILASLREQHNAPPLYYLILHTFTSLGASEFLVRLPSAFFGAIALSACYCLTRHQFDTTVGLLATLLLALSPLHLQYAQEARMYSLFEALALLSLYFFSKAIETHRPRHWLGYVLITGASIYVHYFTVFYVMVQGTFLLTLSIGRRILGHNHAAAAHKEQRAWPSFVLSLIAIALLFLPWLPSALSRNQGAGMSQDLAYVLTTTLRGLANGKNTVLPYLFAGFFVAGLIFCWLNRQPAQGWLLGLWVILPLPLVFLFLTFAQSFFAIRYLIFVLPLYLVGIAQGLISLTRRLTQGPVKPARSYILGILSLVLIAVSLAPIQAVYARPKQPCRALAQFFSAYLATGEQLIVEPHWFIPCLTYYGLDDATTAHGSLAEFQEATAQATGVWYLRLSNPSVDASGTLQQRITEKEYIKLLQGTVEAGGVLLYYKSLEMEPARNMVPVLDYFVQLDPGNANLYFLLASEYEGRGDHEQALTYLQKWRELEPHRAVVHGKIAWTLHRLKRYEEAIVAFRQALELDPIATSYRGLGDSYFKLGKYEEALGAFQAWARLEPENASAQNSLGWTFLLLRDCPHAVKSFKKALDLKPDLAAAKEGLAKCP